MIISWLKLDINILDDAKIKIIRSHPDGDKVFVLWIGLLCLAMKSSRPGIIEISDGLPYTPDDLAHLFDIEKKTVEMGIALFRKYKMVDILDGDTIEIINFSKHQKLEDIEHKRELTRNRTAEYRKRLRGCDAEVTRHSVTVTLTDIEENKNKNKNKRENILADQPPKRTRKIFQIPTVEEITSYCQQRHNGIDPQYFHDYQQARDWILSNGKRMVDWQATIRTWEKNNIGRGNGCNTRFAANQVLSESARRAAEINAEWEHRKRLETCSNATGNAGENTG